MTYRLDEKHKAQAFKKEKVEGGIVFHFIVMDEKDREMSRFAILVPTGRLLKDVLPDEVMDRLGKVKAKPPPHLKERVDLEEET